MSKSYVTFEQHVCLVCGKPYDTGSILMDTRLRDRFQHKTTTGIGWCPLCEKLKGEGYVALVECDDTKLTPFKGEDGIDRITGTAAEARTGRMMYVSSEAFAALFRIAVPKEGLCYIDPETMEIVLKKAEGHIKTIDKRKDT